MTSNVIKIVTLSAVLTALFACSSEPANLPAELVEIKDPIKIRTLWDVDVGSGDDELQLQLEPFVSGPTMYTVDIDGDVEAHAVETGKTIWEVELEQRISGGISGDSQRIYVTSFQGELIALSREDGAEQWRARLSSESLSVVASDGSIVVAHSSDGRIFAFDTRSGVQKWRYDSDSPILSLRGTSTPLIIENSVYVGLSNGELVSLSLLDGRLQWEIALGTASGRTELERLIDADGAFAQQYGALFAVAFQGEVKAIDLASGSEIWSRDISSYSGVALAKAADRLIVSDAAGTVYALDSQTGKDVWSNNELSYRRLGNAAVLGSYAVIPDYEGYLHFFDLTSGTIAGRVETDDDGTMGRLQVVGDVLYVYTRSGDVFAYRLAS